MLAEDNGLSNAVPGNKQQLKVAKKTKNKNVAALIRVSSCGESPIPAWNAVQSEALRDEFAEVHIVYDTADRPSLGAAEDVADVIWHSKLDLSRFSDQVTLVLEIPADVQVKEKCIDLMVKDAQLLKRYDVLHMPAYISPCEDQMSVASIIGSILWNPFLLVLMMISYSAAFVTLRKLDSGYGGKHFRKPRSSWIWSYTKVMNRERGEHCCQMPEVQDMGMNFALRNMRHFTCSFKQLLFFFFYYFLCAIPWWAMLFQQFPWATSWNPAVHYFLARDPLGYMTNSITIGHCLIVYLLFARNNVMFPFHSLLIDMIIYPIYLTIFPLIWLYSKIHVFRRPLTKVK